MKWKSLLLGAATFLAAHAIIVAKWGVWFGGGSGGSVREPWFLNDGDIPIALTAGALSVAAMLAAALGARSRAESVTQGLNVAVGATIAATAVLVSIGPGTLFPIVIVFCAIVAAGSAIVGALVIAAFQKR